MRFAQRDFSLGEFSPRVLGRVDLPYYYRGARLMENYISLPQGGAERRPGTILCDELDVVRDYAIFPYIYGDLFNMLVLVSDTDVNVYKIDKDTTFPSINIERLLDAASAEVSFSSPYSGITDVREIQAYQYQRTLFLAHPEFPLYRIDEDSSGDLFLQTHIMTYRTYDTALNYEPGDVVAYDGEIFTPLESLTAPAPTPEDAEGWWLETGSVTPGLGTVPAWSAGSFSNGDLVVYGELLWRAKVSSGGLEDFAMTVDIANGIEKAGAPPDPPSSSISYWALVSASLPTGTTTLIAYNAVTTYATGDYLYDSALGKMYVSLQDGNTGNDPTDATKWRKIGSAPDFNEPNKYPSLVYVHEGRLIVLGNSENPDTIFCSRTGRFDEMSLGTDDDDAVVFVIGSAGGEAVTWARSRDSLILGTGKSEWRVLGADGGALTPTSKQAFLQTNAGGARNGAIDIGDMLVFLQAGGRRLLRFVFSNDQQAYSTPDMGMLSEHVFAPGVKQMALQTNPDFILWMVMEDGTLVSATYNPAEQIFGWNRHNTDGDVFSIAVTPTGDGEDDIWLSVKRNAGSDQVFLEKFAPRRQETQSDWTYLDCSTALPVTTEQITVDNDIYLQELGLLVDGANHAKITPSGSLPATVTLNYGTTKAVVGLSYTSKLRPQKVVPEDGELGTDIRVAEVGLQLYKTLGMSVGANETDGNIDPVIFQETTQILGDPPVPFTGEKPHSIDHEFSDEDWILIKQDGPFPGRILGVVYSAAIGRNS